MSRFAVEVKPGVSGMQTWILNDHQADATVELVPDRGALVTRYRVQRDELLYLDRKTLADRSKNVRGGIPVLFPIAGPLPQGTYTARGKSYALPQHGFARTRAWWVTESGQGDEGAYVECLLRSDSETEAVFPWPFEFRLRVTLGPAGLRLQSRIRNPGNELLPLHLGFHPYFRVPDDQKTHARVETQATRVWDNRAKTERALDKLDFTQNELDLHLLDHEGGTTLSRGALQPIRLRWSDAFRCLVLWTLQARDFICVEPWTARGGALVTGAGLQHVEPGQELDVFFDLSPAAGR